MGLRGGSFHSTLKCSERVERAEHMERVERVCCVSAACLLCVGRGVGFLGRE